MDTNKANQLIEQLSMNITGLSEALQPVLKGRLHDTANKLPVLDRAKLYIFITYTIESILFSNLRLQGIDANKHPIFTEITRVRQYFEKLAAAEQGDQKTATNLPSMRLDRAAAGRIVKHDLAANSNMGTKRRFSQEATDSKPSLNVQAPAQQDDQDGSEETSRKGKKGRKSISGRGRDESKAGAKGKRSHATET